MPPEGFLLIDKPAGPTSHDVIDRLRKITGFKKIGHAGTLDPFASGLLIVAVGRGATKNISDFVGLDKEYKATFILGATTETLDTEGDVVKDADFNPANVSETQIREAAKQFLGEQKQIPPMHAAIKVKGKKLYELARQGKTIEPEPRPVRISRFHTGSATKNDGLLEIPVTIMCSSGTYVRAMARDLATALGTTGYVSKLRRTGIGPFKVEESQALDGLSTDNWQHRLIPIEIMPAKLEKMA